MPKKVNIGGVTYPSFNCSNGVGMEIYLSGCNRQPKCDGCHNPELWSFNAGVCVTIEEIVEIINDKEYLDAVAIMGGEPLDNHNIFDILQAVVETGKEIWLYTSYELEEVPEEIRQLCNFIKTGRYEHKLKSPADAWLASTNQHVFKRDKLDFYQLM